MRPVGTTERVIGAIVVTAVLPLVIASLFSSKMIERVSETAFQPEFGVHLDRALGVYADLAKAIKGGLRAEGEAVARSPALVRAATASDKSAMREALEAEIRARSSIVSLQVTSCEGDELASAKRREPLDEARERGLSVEKNLGAPSGDGIACGDGGPPAMLHAVFAAPRARLDELEEVEAFTRAYHEIERTHRAEYVDTTYARAFEVLLALTIAVGVGLGVLVARPVTKRIARLAAATQPVAEGDLSVRVRFEGKDEIAELGRAFDRMLEELEQSRARVEFLRRMSEFQKMARRLAHEIKNPLTPIQLAVEEAHRRYTGSDPEYKRVVQTMYEVVEEEVGSLRRLVSEFSSFARLPRAELAPGDLGELLRDQRARFEATRASDAGEDALLAHVELEFDVEPGAMPAAIDREMLHRVLSNVLQNAAQALRDARKKGKDGAWGKVRVTARASHEGFTLDVDDDGPGIAEDVRSSVFDPYVTTKRDGTGLGLSIVKKIVVDHGGTIEAGKGPLGGARFRIVLPRLGTAASRAAIERSVAATREGVDGR